MKRALGLIMVLAFGLPVYGRSGDVDFNITSCGTLVSMEKPEKNTAPKQKKKKKGRKPNKADAPWPHFDVAENEAVGKGTWYDFAGAVKEAERNARFELAKKLGVDIMPGCSLVEKKVFKDGNMYNVFVKVRLETGTEIKEE